ncbi:hypothetical protein EXIGLDRAFT_696794 [Exidia glandulosa HHB12029]|uniref:Uncharacterized protein n=1 Tax=Exidia glandulosa HHB12029 TaxID=1314781 RepID=A0A165F5A6_EXIGL|nr:hypothetical protein EXIGLDRAFT_696794 [Exidia glandulosa HHB12029]
MAHPFLQPPNAPGVTVTPTDVRVLNAISFAGEAELYHNQGGEDVDCDTGAVWAAAESYRQDVITAYGANEHGAPLWFPDALQSSLRGTVERIVEAELGPILQQLEDKMDGIPATVQAAIDNAVEKTMNPVLRQLHELRVGQICLTNKLRGNGIIEAYAYHEIPFLDGRFPSDAVGILTLS